MINVGDRVRYFGISYIVTSVSELVVKLRREKGGTIELSVCIGSDRFKAMFPKEQKQIPVRDFSVVPEVEVEELGSGKIMNISGEFNIKEDSPFYEIISKYSTEYSDLAMSESTSGVKAELKRDLTKDKTGLLRFIMLTWANRNNAYKFDATEIAQMCDSGQFDKDRPSTDISKLKEFYLASLQDDNEATLTEKHILCRILPIKYAPELLLCFCGFDWDWYGHGTCLLKIKNINECLDAVPDNLEAKELSELEDEYEEDLC